MLSAGERQQIADQGGKAIQPILAAWVADPAFVETGRRFIEDLLSVSGSSR